MEFVDKPKDAEKCLIWEVLHKFAINNLPHSKPYKIKVKEINLALREMMRLCN